MPNKPTPRNGENAEAAEARLKALRGRFSRVSRRMGGSTVARQSTATAGNRFQLSSFEWLIAAGVIVFLLAVGGMALA